MKIITFSYWMCVFTHFIHSITFCSALGYDVVCCLHTMFAISLYLMPASTQLVSIQHPTDSMLLMGCILFLLWYGILLSVNHIIWLWRVIEMNNSVRYVDMYKHIHTFAWRRVYGKGILYGPITGTATPITSTSTTSSLLCMPYV